MGQPHISFTASAKSRHSAKKKSRGCGGVPHREKTFEGGLGGSPGVRPNEMGKDYLEEEEQTCLRK